VCRSIAKAHKTIDSGSAEVHQIIMFKTILQNFALISLNSTSFRIFISVSVLQCNCINLVANRVLEFSPRLTGLGRDRKRFLHTLIVLVL